MAKKSKLSKDAFDWVKPTTQETQPAPPARIKTTEDAPPKAGGPALKRGRIIFVRYKKRSGEIVAILEMPMEQQAMVTNPFINVPAEDEVEGFTLVGAMLDKELIDIHTKYQVDTSGKAPKLVPKR